MKHLRVELDDKTHQKLTVLKAHFSLDGRRRSVSAAITDAINDLWYRLRDEQQVPELTEGEL